MQSTTAICPSLFNATSAQDGILSRIRLPAGLITTVQCEAIAQLVNQFGNGEVQITNRANIQIRTSQALTSSVLERLQQCGLASQTASIDGLRNIMASPTAGIDIQSKIDTIPFVKQWDEYLANHPELEILSSKFSVCFDGGETVNVGDRPNDICLLAVEIAGEVYFSLHLSLGDRGNSPSSVRALIAPNQVLEVLAALAEVYRDYTSQKTNQVSSSSCKPRLRELLHEWGVEYYLQLVETELGYPLSRLSENLEISAKTEPYDHVGIHAQMQSGLVYMGVIVPLGRLTSHQLQGLGQLAKKYGDETLRLTPWQNLLITNIAETQTEHLTQEITNLGLSISSNHPYTAIAACSGSTGCKASFTNTQADAKAIATHLEKCIELDRPINIHFSGCDKSCAQHHPSDIALVGVQTKNLEAYKVYIGNGHINFGRELYAEYPAKDLPNLIERLLKIYQSQRQNSNQNFREFVNKCHLRELKQLLDYA